MPKQLVVLSHLLSRTQAAMKFVYRGKERTLKSIAKRMLDASTDDDTDWVAVIKALAPKRRRGRPTKSRKLSARAQREKYIYPPLRAKYQELVAADNPPSLLLRKSKAMKFCVKVACAATGLQANTVKREGRFAGNQRRKS